MIKKIPLLIALMILSPLCLAQLGGAGISDDDLNVGGDIFSDFNEDLEASKVMEDERYYRYGRFFTFNISLGITDFTGNRGLAYKDEHPSYGLSLHYFSDFNSAFGLGFAFSKHYFILSEPVAGYGSYNSEGTPLGVGLVTVKALRVFFDYRYYIDTADLGTAITYSNPYFVGRMEYWYLTNKFVDQERQEEDKGGGLGFAGGFGLEFPIKLKESYTGLEFLYHRVNFHDKYTQKYQPHPNNPDGFGYEDFTGDVISVMISYVFNW